jgi:hypothetical protein
MNPMPQVRNLPRLAAEDATEPATTLLGLNRQLPECYPAESAIAASHAISTAENRL